MNHIVKEGLDPSMSSDRDYLYQMHHGKQRWHWQDDGRIYEPDAMKLQRAVPVEHHRENENELGIPQGQYPKHMMEKASPSIPKPQI